MISKLIDLSNSVYKAYEYGHNPQPKKKKQTKVHTILV